MARAQFHFTRKMAVQHLGRIRIHRRTNRSPHPTAHGQRQPDVLLPACPTRAGHPHATTGADLEILQGTMRKSNQATSNTWLKSVWAEDLAPPPTPKVVRPAPPTTPRPADEHLADINQRMAFHLSWVLDQATREEITNQLAEQPDSTNHECNQRKSKEGSALFAAWSRWQETHQQHPS